MGPTIPACGWCAFARRCVSVLLLGAAVGCGSGKGTVSGRVLVGKEKEPLPGGYLTFAPMDPQHNAVPVTIGPDGRYEVTVPVGEMRICVDNREWKPTPSGDRPNLKLPGIKLPPGIKGAAPAAPAQENRLPHPGKYREILPKYYQVETSELKYTVTSGSQTHDIELK